MVNVYIRSFSRKTNNLGRAIALLGGVVLPLALFAVYVLAQQDGGETTEKDGPSESSAQVNVQLSDESIAFDVTIETADEAGDTLDLDSYFDSDQPPLPAEFDLGQEIGLEGADVEPSTAASSPSDLPLEVDPAESQRLKDALRAQVQVGQAVPLNTKADESKSVEPQSAAAGPVRISISDDAENAEGDSGDDFTSVDDVARDLYDLFLSDLVVGPALTSDNNAEATSESPSTAIRELPTLELPLLNGSIFTITESPFDLSGKGESTIPNWRRPAR